jgi:hypothetical protein
MHSMVPKDDGRCIKIIIRAGSPERSGECLQKYKTKAATQNFLYAILTVEQWRAKRSSMKHSMHNQVFLHRARKIGMCYIKIIVWNGGVRGSRGCWGACPSASSDTRHVPSSSGKKGRRIKNTDLCGRG